MDPADGSAAKAGAPRVMPLPARVGPKSTLGRDDPADADPAAPARTSRGARPAFMTIERENPDLAVSVSI